MPSARSATDIARLIRMILFPIGTRRYEVYKSARRALLPGQHYPPDWETSIKAEHSDRN